MPILTIIFSRYKMNHAIRGGKMKNIGLDFETSSVGYFDKGTKARRSANSNGHPRHAKPTHLALATESDVQIIVNPKVTDFPVNDHLIMFNAAFDLMVAQTQRDTTDMSQLYSQSFDDVLVMMKVLGVS